MCLKGTMWCYCWCCRCCCNVFHILDVFLAYEFVCVKAQHGHPKWNGTTIGTNHSYKVIFSVSCVCTHIVHINVLAFVQNKLTHTTAAYWNKYRNETYSIDLSFSPKRFVVLRRLLFTFVCQYLFDVERTNATENEFSTIPLSVWKSSDKYSKNSYGMCNEETFKSLPIY